MGVRYSLLLFPRSTSSPGCWRHRPRERERGGRRARGARRCAAAARTDRALVETRARRAGHRFRAAVPAAPGIARAPSAVPALHRRRGCLVGRLDALLHPFYSATSTSCSPTGARPGASSPTPTSTGGRASASSSAARRAPAGEVREPPRPAPRRDRGARQLLDRRLGDETLRLAAAAAAGQPHRLLEPVFDVGPGNLPNGSRSSADPDCSMSPSIVDYPTSGRTPNPPTYLDGKATNERVPTGAEGAARDAV